jgi:hypothetical protein
MTPEEEQDLISWLIIELGWAKAEYDQSVRLQLVGEEMYLWCGSPQYDTNHRGSWGAGELPGNATAQQRIDLAKDMVDQALDHKAQEGE